MSSGHAGQPVFIADDDEKLRHLLAAVCRRAESAVRARPGEAATLLRQIAATMAAESALRPNPVEPPLPELPPRLRQTLQRLLAGDGEKQIARHLGVSVHTAHAHINRLYRKLNVSGRGELLARFVSPAITRS